MAEVFCASSTADEVLRDLDLNGMRVLVTGVSAGIGVETARSLVAHGAKVIGAARNLSKAMAATEQILEQVAEGGELDWCNSIWHRWRACAPALTPWLPRASRLTW